MRHRPRITLLVLVFFALCVLTVMLFASLPAYHDRPSGPGLGALRTFGPSWPKIGLLSCRVTHELDPTLTLVSPKTGGFQ
jgi:hypothetical protein